MAIDPDKPHAFLSYTRFDNDYLEGEISWLRDALEKARIQERNCVSVADLSRCRGYSDWGSVGNQNFDQALVDAQFCSSAS